MFSYANLFKARAHKDSYAIQCWEEALVREGGLGLAYLYITHSLDGLDYSGFSTPTYGLQHSSQAFMGL
jgi:hypothetical protein